MSGSRQSPLPGCTQGPCLSERGLSGWWGRALQGRGGAHCRPHAPRGVLTAPSGGLHRPAGRHEGSAPAPTHKCPNAARRIRGYTGPELATTRRPSAGRFGGRLLARWGTGTAPKTSANSHRAHTEPESTSGTTLLTQCSQEETPLCVLDAGWGCPAGVTGGAGLREGWGQSAERCTHGQCLF